MMSRIAFGSSTPSMQMIAGMGAARKKKRASSKRSRGVKRGRKSTTASKVAKSPKRRSSKKPARLVKGSAAAKAYMAKIRKKRR